MNIKKSVKVSHPPNVVYLFWKRFQEFPQMVKYIKRVEKFRGDRAIWTVNRFICWESEIVHDDPNVRIGWRTIPGSTITHYGNVHFEEIKEGKTKVTVVISYLVPFGKAGKAVVKLFNPLIGSILKREMIRLKKFIKSS